MSEYISKNAFLTEEEMKVNVKYIYNYLSPRGWSLNAICGMLGNMETESSINPGIWQNLDAGNASLGFGLVQWTPSTKYTSWCSERGLEPSAMDSALARIEWELENGEQYYPTDAYPLTFAEFKVSTAPVLYLAQVFLHNYERPADQTQPARSEQAAKWYAYLKQIEGTGSGGSGGSGDVSTGDSGIPYEPREKKSLPLWLLVSATRRR